MTIIHQEDSQRTQSSMAHPLQSLLDFILYLLMKNKRNLRIAFLHPDLGLGGAEQLVINLALSCKNLGHYVKIFTPSFDPKRAFSQTTDGTLDVEVQGNIFPRRIFGKCQAICEYIRVLIAALYLILFGGHFDIVVCDQIPIAVPFLRLRFKTFFYCHFPDKLLCVERKSLIKKIYRLFIDFIEEASIFFANAIAVNSNYTLSVVKENFRFISRFCPDILVIYPANDVKSFDKDIVSKKDLEKLSIDENLKKDIASKEVLISLNRYERKKNIELAVTSFIHFLEKLSKLQPERVKNYVLFIAGGYDDRLNENKEVYERCKSIADQSQFKNSIIFLRSISNFERSCLLKCARLVIYTPRNEHFGMVPTEAMYCGAFVLAHKSGGPTESIKDNSTGYLVDSEDPKIWGEKIHDFFFKFNYKGDLREYLREYSMKNFSLDSMTESMRSIIKDKLGFN